MVIRKCCERSLTSAGPMAAARWIELGQRWFNARGRAPGYVSKQPRAVSHTVRRLQPEDALALILHFSRLSPPDRFLRFNGRVGFYALWKRYREINWERTRIYGVFEGKRLIGVAELAEFFVNGESCAELALSVNGNRQGRGLGGMLFRSALEIADKQGHVRIFLSCRADNAALIGLARKHAGIPTRSRDEVQFVYEIAVNAALQDPAENVFGKHSSNKFI